MRTVFDADPIHIFDLLPHLLRFKNKEVVIKYGGNAMVDDELKRNVIRDIVFLKLINLKPVVVHGGGPEIDNLLDRVGLESTFVEGHRKTDADTMEVVEMVLSGKVNSELVKLINMEGVSAVGVSGKDGALVTARKHHRQLKKDGKTRKLDLGQVGEVVEINTDLLRVLIDHDHVPVVSPVAVGKDGQDYNINADVLAGEIAASLNVEETIFLTDVDGIRRDAEDVQTLITEMDVPTARDLICQGVIQGGMIPKVEAAITAIEGGVHRAHIINGTIQHSILASLLSDEGTGTRIHPIEE